MGRIVSLQKRKLLETPDAFMENKIQHKTCIKIIDGAEDNVQSEWKDSPDGRRTIEVD